MKKRLCALLALIMLFAAAGCSSKPKTYTYEKLEPTEQATIDFIYSQRDEWCTKKLGEISLGDLDGIPCLYAFYLDSQDSGSYYGWRVWYLYNEEAKTFEKKDSQYASYTVVSGSNPSGYKPKVDPMCDEKTMKNYLADKYGQAYKNK